MDCLYNLICTEYATLVLEYRVDLLKYLLLIPLLLNQILLNIMLLEDVNINQFSVTLIHIFEPLDIPPQLHIKLLHLPIIGPEYDLSSESLTPLHWHIGLPFLSLHEGVLLRHYHGELMQEVLL